MKCIICGSEEGRTYAYSAGEDNGYGFYEKDFYRCDECGKASEDEAWWNYEYHEEDDDNRPGDA
jgi:hypothetical protein